MPATCCRHTAGPLPHVHTPVRPPCHPLAGCPSLCVRLGPPSPPSPHLSPSLSLHPTPTSTPRHYSTLSGAPYPPHSTPPHLSPRPCHTTTRPHTCARALLHSARGASQPTTSPTLLPETRSPQLPPAPWPPAAAARALGGAASCQPLLGSWLFGLHWGGKKCPPCTIRGGCFESEASWRARARQTHTGGSCHRASNTVATFGWKMCALRAMEFGQRPEP